MKKNTNTWAALASAAVLATLLAGCATPQEIAVRNYCYGKGYDQYPAHVVTVTERQYVITGQRVTGQTQTCTTAKPDSKGNVTQTCTSKDIVEDVWDWRNVQVDVDTNAPDRNLVVQVCSSESLRDGLFAELNDKKK